MSDTLDPIDASGIDNMKDTEDNILPFTEDNEPLPNKQDQLINTDETFDYYDNDIPDSNKQTIGMTILFLVLMILYIGFCVYYRKVIKTRQAVDDVETSERRQRQHRENQVCYTYVYLCRFRYVVVKDIICSYFAYHYHLIKDVLEESMSATTRARNNTLEQAKLEERKNNIKKVLKFQLIVDDDDDVQSKEEGGENEGDDDNTNKVVPPEEANVVCTSDSNCKCELCQYWQWESPNAAKTTESEKRVGGGGEEEISSDVQGDAATSNVAISRRIITIQEEDSDEEDDEEEVDKETREKDVDVEAQEQEAVDESSLTTPAAPPSSSQPSPNSSPQGSPRTSQPSPASSPSRLSLPSTPKKISDALSCGSSRSGRSHSDALSCGGSSSKLNCSHNHSSRKSENKCKENDDTPAVPFSDIASLYGEECNVCLAHFQVGDRVATSKDSAQCSHIFHEECISRWLLVRDGCPICRRSYFPDAVSESANAADIESGMEEEGDMRSSPSFVAVNMATED